LGFLRINHVLTAEWNKLKKDAPKKSTEELVLDYMKCPTWYFEDLKRKKNARRQTAFAIALCNRVGVRMDRFLTLHDINMFEELLNVDVLVFVPEW